MTETNGQGQVHSVNVGQPRLIEWLGQVATTAIWKAPVEGRIAARGVNLVGDDQADREVHGGRDKAIYSYAREDEDWWAEQLGRPVEDGTFGENLTLSGMDVSNAVIGERWEIGSVLLEVCQPRIPCWKLGARMNDPHFPPRFGAAMRPGAYLRVLREGEIGAGDTVQVVHRPTHGVTVRDIARIYHKDRSEADVMLTAPELAQGWKRWARNVLSHRKARSGRE
jgi:MOSC domain-containing protein YiiM